MWIWNCEFSSRDAGVRTAHANRARAVREYLGRLADADILDKAIEVQLTMADDSDNGITALMADVIVKADPRDHPDLVPDP